MFVNLWKMPAFTLIRNRRVGEVDETVGTRELITVRTAGSAANRSGECVERAFVTDRTPKN